MSAVVKQTFPSLGEPNGSYGLQYTAVLEVATLYTHTHKRIKQFSERKQPDFTCCTQVSNFNSIVVISNLKALE